MSSVNFDASVQYGDLKGTSAADNSDINDAMKWLDENGYKESGEFLIGIKMSVGENHGVHTDPVFVEFIFVSPGDYDTVKTMIDSTRGAIAARRVAVEMPLLDFYSLFKRISISISANELLAGRECIYDD